MKPGTNGRGEEDPALSRKLDPLTARAIMHEVKDGTITCAACFNVAAELSLPPSRVGNAVDLLSVKIVKCQLGLFGHGPAGRAVTPSESVAPELETRIKAALAQGRLPCEEAWKIAQELGVGKMEVACAGEALDVRIKPCQLGVF